MRRIDRRGFLAATLAAVVVRPARAQDTTQGGSGGTADPLRQPWIAGNQRDTVTALDNDPMVIAIERRMRCTCGCTLDIYTCRTTDFTCTYSPALHKELVAMVQEGKTPEEILAFFVAREGEAILMAPEAEGFNLAGYLVPGLVIATAGLGLGAYLARRREAGGGPDSGGPERAAVEEPPPPTDEAAERLRRALDEVDA